jgi:ankyrin repeat protein
MTNGRKIKNLQEYNRVAFASSTSAYSEASVVGKPLLISLHTKSKTSRAHNRTATQSSQKQRSPHEVLRSILFENPKGSNNNSSSFALLSKTDRKRNNDKNVSTLSFQTPNESDVESYDMESVRAVRTGDVERLRELYRSGKSLDACNAFGESLLHMACRRGDLKMVRFLLGEVKVRSNRCDDFGRNPLHDAMWTSTPHTEVMDVLMDHVDPSMLLAEDVRGNTPFAYARREHDAKWIEFLEQRKEKLRQKHDASLSSTDRETDSGGIAPALPADFPNTKCTKIGIDAEVKNFANAIADL